MTTPATPAIPFDYAGWVAAFPQFAAINQADGQSYYDTAGMYCANDVFNPAFCIQVAQGTVMVPALQRLLWLLTCHLAFLGAFRDAAGNPSSTGTVPPSPLVGRVSAATEGSVNVSVELNEAGYPIPAFFSQTSWGLAYWTASAPYRTMHYSPMPTIVVDGAYPAFPYLGSRGTGWR